MKRLRPFCLLAMLAAPLALGGCYVGAAGGDVMVEAHLVSDGYKPEQGAASPSDPTPDQLAPVPKVVLLPFYAQTAENKVELRPAVYVSGINGRLQYPPRPYMSTWSSANVIDHAAIVFARGAWPCILYSDSNPPGGSIWEKDFPPDRVQPLGVTQFMRPVLYRDSRPYDDVVDRAANDNSLLLIFQLHLDDLAKAVDTAPGLKPAQRLMVYSQLHAVAVNVAYRFEAGHRKSIYTAAAEKLAKHMRTLTEARK